MRRALAAAAALALIALAWLLWPRARTAPPPPVAPSAGDAPTQPSAPSVRLNRPLPHVAVREDNGAPPPDEWPHKVPASSVNLKK